jgi:hypothetical protein
MRKKFLIALPLLVGAGAGAIYWYVNQQARQQIDQRMQEAVASGAYDALEYETMQVHLNGDVTMTNLRIAAGSADYTLREIHVSNMDYAHEIPWQMDVVVNGLAFADSGSSDPRQAALIAFMRKLAPGDTIPLQVQYSHRYDPANDHQTDSSMRMSVPDAFTLDFASITRKLPLAAAAGGNSAVTDPAFAQNQLLAQYPDAEIPSVNINLQDQGIVDALILEAAANNRVPPEEFRNLLVSQARNLYLFTPQNMQGLVMSTGIELARFLEGGKTLSVSMTPEYGGKVRQLQEEIMGAVFTGNFGLVAELLHVEITAE